MSKLLRVNTGRERVRLEHYEPSETFQLPIIGQLRFTVLRPGDVCILLGAWQGKYFLFTKDGIASVRMSSDLVFRRFDEL